MSNWPYGHYHRQVPGLKVISTVEGQLIPIATLRQHCRVIPTATDSSFVDSNPEEDASLLVYLGAAIEHAEDYTGLSIALRTYELALDSFRWNSPWHGSGIELPRAPFISIQSFYSPEGGSSDGEFDLGDDYLIDDYRVPTRLLPVSTWPSVTSSSNTIKIRFRAGYRSDDYFDTDYAGAETLPAVIKQALLLLVGHFYENRADSVEKSLSSIPTGVEALLRPKRILLGMA